VEPPSLVAARGITRRFGATVALDRIDLDVRAGEPVAVFGVNGAGKTTLLRILSGGLRSDGGTLTIRGGRGRIGFLSHQTLLYDDLTARENLAFFAALHGVPDPAGRAGRMLEDIGLADRADEPVRGFSRGMQQRVALARALAPNPAILIADEPTGNLDEATGAEIVDLMFAGHDKRGTTLVLVTHDAALARRCDRVVRMRSGRVDVQS
jgi:putative ABC transport system ATP-binding protein